MKRIAISSLAVLLVASPIVGLAAVGASFLASAQEKPHECRPVSLVGVGSEPTLVKLFIARRDAWTQYPDEFGGYAHVRRAADGKLIVLSPIGPRLGDFIDYEPALGCFQSACFRSRFDLDGRWFHDPNDSMHRMEDMRPMPIRVVGDELFVAAPFEFYDPALRVR